MWGKEKWKEVKGIWVRCMSSLALQRCGIGIMHICGICRNIMFKLEGKEYWKQETQTWRPRGREVDTGLGKGCNIVLLQLNYKQLCKSR